MKGNLLSSASAKLSSLCLLLVMMLTSATAMAQTETFVLGQKYDCPIWMQDSKEMYFTPENDGVLKIYSQMSNIQVTPQPDGETVASNFLANPWTDSEGNEYSKCTSLAVQAGVTYEVYANATFGSKGYYFIGVMEEAVSELKLVKTSHPAGEVYNITDSRDGQVTFLFNLPATSDAKATLKCGDNTAEIDVRPDYNSGSILCRLKEPIYGWLQDGSIKGGEEMTLTLTGVCASADNSIKFGTDGRMVVTWIAPSKPHYHLSTSGVPEFKSYWIAGDPDGIAVLEFDGELMTYENGQTARARLLIGNSEAGDAYAEQIDAENFRVDGNKLYIDFTGKRRAYEDMGLKNKWGDITIQVSDILMADGTSCFNPNAGNYGSVSFSRSFVELRSDIAAEFTPASGENLEDNQFKVYFSEKKSYIVNSVRVTYQTMEDVKYQIDITEGITSEEFGDNAIEYTVPLPAELLNCKNIRVSFPDAISVDGFEHEFNVRYNPGPELIDDLKPVSESIENNAIVTNFAGLSMTFDEDVFIHELSAGMTTVSVTDETTGQPVAATISVDPDNSKRVVITPEKDFIDTHKYSAYVNFEVVVNKEYVETSGKYGRYMPGKEINFTLFANYADYEFLTDPIVGSTVSELRSVTCVQKPNTSDSEWAISITRNPDKPVWVEDEAGNKVSDCTLTDDIISGFTITLTDPVTTTGRYTIVLSDSVYSRGEGYTVWTNENPVRLEYNVLAAPVPSISVEDSDPATETTVESLHEIMVSFNEWVYGEDVAVSLYNPLTREVYPGTLSINPKNRNMALITLDQEVTAAGNYQLVLAEGIVGDQVWFESGAMTGKVNALTTLYFTISEGQSEEVNVTTDPANNSTVESLSRIVMTFNDYSEVAPGAGKISVRKNGIEIGVAEAEIDWDIADLNVLVINYSATEDGVYTFEVPEGHINDQAGNPIPAFTLTYTIGTGEAPAVNVTTDPANGSEVASLSRISMTFNDYEEVSVGYGTVIVKKDGVQVDKIDVEYGSFDDPWNMLVINYSATEPGVYTFEVLEASVSDENGNGLPAFTLTYTVSNSTGIDSILGESQVANVYGIDGRMIKKNATKANLNNLHGVYIINGKKVVLE